MNDYIARSKEIVRDYLGKVQATEEKIRTGKEIYMPDHAEAEENRLRGALAKDRQAAESRLDSIYQEAVTKAKAWSRLDGSKLTADAELLKGQGVTPDQFDDLVARYKDNFTMLDQLRKYGEMRNQEAAIAAHAAGKHEIDMGQYAQYDVDSIPGADDLVVDAENIRKQAGYFLNVADGRNMDVFTLSFARAAAEKDFNAWGADDGGIK